MESAFRVQIQHKAFRVRILGKTFGKGMNSSDVLFGFLIYMLISVYYSMAKTSLWNNSETIKFIDVTFFLWLNSCVSMDLVFSFSASFGPSQIHN